MAFPDLTPAALAVAEQQGVAHLYAEICRMLDDCSFVIDGEDILEHETRQHLISNVMRIFHGEAWQYESDTAEEG